MRTTCTNGFVYAIAELVGNPVLIHLLIKHCMHSAGSNVADAKANEAPNASEVCETVILPLWFFHTACRVIWRLTLAVLGLSKHQKYQNGCSR